MASASDDSVIKLQRTLRTPSGSSGGKDEGQDEGKHHGAVCSQLRSSQLANHAVRQKQTYIRVCTLFMCTPFSSSERRLIMRCRNENFCPSVTSAVSPPQNKKKWHYKTKLVHKVPDVTKTVKPRFLLFPSERNVLNSNCVTFDHPSGLLLSPQLHILQANSSACIDAHSNITDFVFSNAQLCTNMFEL